MRRNMGNKGGAMRGLEMASAMSGRDLSGMGRPTATGLQQAAAMSGRTMPEVGFPNNVSPAQMDRILTPNSRAQFMQNRQAGDPLAMENSYNRWKKL